MATTITLPQELVDAAIEHAGASPVTNNDVVRVLLRLIREGQSNKKRVRELGAMYEASDDTCRILNNRLNSMRDRLIELAEEV